MSNLPAVSNTSAVLPTISFAIISRQETLVFAGDFSINGSMYHMDTRYQAFVYGCLDTIELRLRAQFLDPITDRDLFMADIGQFFGQIAHAYITPSGSIFIIMVPVKEAQKYNEDILKAFFVTVNKMYLLEILNPLYIEGQDLMSETFCTMVANEIRLLSDKSTYKKGYVRKLV